MEDLSSFWQDIAKRQIMKEEVHENIQKMTEKECQKYASPKILQDGIVRAKDIKVSKKDTILEIGAGPGIISFELAKRAKHLTAIEPSLGFSSIFMKKSRELGITNVNIVTDFFENFDITQKYDIVVSSFSLITLNIVDFLSSEMKTEGLELKKGVQAQSTIYESLTESQDIIQVTFVITTTEDSNNIKTIRMTLPLREEEKSMYGYVIVGKPIITGFAE